jgi:hypothetical protein
MGLPTIAGQTRSSRAAWRSSASDLSYLTVDPARAPYPCRRARAALPL